jgi:hypothetical protein
VPSSPATIDGLVEGVAYTFSVTVATANGESSASPPSLPAQYGVGLPTPPVVTSVVAGSGAATVFFRAPTLAEALQPGMFNHACCCLLITLASVNLYLPLAFVFFRAPTLAEALQPGRANHLLSLCHQFLLASCLCYRTLTHDSSLSLPGDWANGE